MHYHETLYFLEPRHALGGYRVSVVARCGDRAPRLVWLSQVKMTLYEAMEDGRNYLTLSAAPARAKAVEAA